MLKGNFIFKRKSVPQPKRFFTGIPGLLPWKWTFWTPKKSWRFGRCFFLHRGPPIFRVPCSFFGGLWTGFSLPNFTDTPLSPRNLRSKNRKPAWVFVWIGGGGGVIRGGSVFGSCPFSCGERDLSSSGFINEVVKIVPSLKRTAKTNVLGRWNFRIWGKYRPIFRGKSKGENSVIGIQSNILDGIDDAPQLLHLGSVNDFLTRRLQYPLVN